MGSGVSVEVLFHITESAETTYMLQRLRDRPIKQTHTLKYDSTHGRFHGEIIVKNDTLDIGYGPVKVFSYDLRN